MDRYRARSCSRGGGKEIHDTEMKPTSVSLNFPHPLITYHYSTLKPT